jgi:hypothetical protein
VTRERDHSSGPRPFNAAALRVAAVATGFVVLISLLFGGLGAWQDRDARAPSGSAAPAPEPAPVPAPVPTPVVPAPTPAPVPPADEDPADDVEVEEPVTPTVPATRPNSEVSVQILDGISGGGATAVSRVVATLREAGFRIVAQNTGRAYDVTTVFYSDGFEAEGRRVAQAIGAEVVRAMSELPPERRLTSNVNVHVIVGADRS